MDFLNIAKEAKEASLKLANLPSSVKNNALETIANALELSKARILNANQLDLDDAKNLSKKGNFLRQFLTA